MMLRRANGATVDEVMTATGWQRHTVRGMVSAALKKKLGLNVTSTKEKRGRRDFPRARARVAHGARGLQLKGRRSTEWDPPPQVRFARTHRWSLPGGAVRSDNGAVLAGHVLCGQVRSGLVWGFSCQAVVLGCAESFLFGAGKAVFRPVACNQVPGARGRGQGTETLAELGGLPPSVACVSQRLDA